METEGRKKPRTITEQIADLERSEKRAKAATKNRQAKIRELNKRLAEEKRKALVKILKENGIETENELKQMLEKAKKYDEYEKQ